MDAAPPPTEPGVTITLPWLATQLIPSPELAYGDDVAHFGVRWQPWRFFVAEPYVRQSGSVELFVTPEYLAYGSSVGDGWILRTGVRSYFPLIEHGEYLSVSVGASSFVFGGKWGAAYEAGAYALFGIVGVQLTMSPTPSAAPIATIATLRIRYF